MMRQPGGLNAPQWTTSTLHCAQFVTRLSPEGHLAASEWERHA